MAGIIDPKDMGEAARNQEPQGGGISRYVTELPMPKTADARKRRREQVEQTVNETKTGALTFLIMGRAAIRVAVQTEPNPRVREAKWQRLKKLWSEFEGRLLGVVRS